MKNTHVKQQLLFCSVLYWYKPAIPWQPVLIWHEKPVVLILLSNLTWQIPASYPGFHTRWREISWVILGGTNGGTFSWRCSCSWFVDIRWLKFFTTKKYPIYLAQEILIFMGRGESWLKFCTIKNYSTYLALFSTKNRLRQGDGRKRGTNSISLVTKIVPVGPWGSRKISLSSKMMNSQHQHIQKRELVDLQLIKYKYKSKEKILRHSI